MDTSDEFIHAISFGNEFSGPNKSMERQSTLVPLMAAKNPQPSCSGYVPTPRAPPREVPQATAAEQQAEVMIREAKAGKATIFPPKGKDFSYNPNVPVMALMDQDYLVVGNHVDEATQFKIIAGQYVDFSKLLPKDKLFSDDDKLELVIKNGKTYWSPVSDAVTINNFTRWEQAFRVYSNIFTRGHPQKSGELIEYNQVIYSIAQTYIWENVYAYDKEFRLHMARHHPNRSWAIILQQAWSMNLRDRLPNHLGNQSGQAPLTPNYQSGGKPRTDYCKRYNKGKCTLGSGCMFKHRCSYCDKFGHGVLVCRKLIYDKEKNHRRSGHKDHKDHQHKTGLQHGNNGKKTELNLINCYRKQTANIGRS